MMIIYCVCVNMHSHELYCQTDKKLEACKSLQLSTRGYSNHFSNVLRQWAMRYSWLRAVTHASCTHTPHGLHTPSHNPPPALSAKWMHVARPHRRSFFLGEWLPLFMFYHIHICRLHCNQLFQFSAWWSIVLSSPHTVLTSWDGPFIPLPTPLPPLPPLPPNYHCLSNTGSSFYCVHS